MLVPRNDDARGVTKDKIYWTDRQGKEASAVL